MLRKHIALMLSIVMLATMIPVYADETDPADVLPTAPVEDVVDRPTEVPGEIDDPTPGDSGETDPAETTPDQSAPSVTPPAETEPVETVPAETEPVITEPVETEAAATEPAATEPIETEPVVTEPVESEPVESEPVETEPVETEPAETAEPIVTDEPVETETPVPAPLEVSLVAGVRSVFVGDAAQATLTVSGGSGELSVVYQVTLNGEETVSATAAKAIIDGTDTFTLVPTAHGDHTILATVTDEAGQTAHASVAIPVAEHDTTSLSHWTERAKKVELTGDWRQDLLAVAKTQLGYEQSATDFVILEDGARHYYSIYGALVGAAYEAWDTSFIAFCAKLAEIPVIPRTSDAAQLLSAMKSRGAFESGKDYAPAAGDLVFFQNEERQLERAAIVAAASETEIQVISGSRAVIWQSYRLNDPAIMGYASMETLMIGAGVLQAEEPDPLAVTSALAVKSAFVGDEVVLNLSVSGGEGELEASYRLAVDGEMLDEETNSESVVEGENTFTFVPATLGDYRIVTHVMDEAEQVAETEVLLPVAEHDVTSLAEWTAKAQAVTLTGNWQQDVVAVAKSQLGYTESETDFVVLEDDSRHNYSVYGDWYGTNYQDWNAEFVSFVMAYAGVPTSAVPQTATAEALLYAMQGAGAYASTADHQPAAGDLAFLANGRVGIVTSADESGVQVIEGDHDGAVVISSGAVTGYASMYGIMVLAGELIDPSTAAAYIARDVGAPGAQDGKVYYESLQAAVNDVQSNETIQLLRDVHENVLSENKSYTLNLSFRDEATSPLQRYTIFGDKQGSVYTIKGGQVTLSTGILQGGAATNGGGLYVENATVKLDGMSIHYCSATDNGGGLYVKNSNVTFMGNENRGLSYIANNTATNGGGIYATGSDTAITFQWAEESWRSSDSIKYNSATGNGGAIALVDGANATLCMKMQIHHNTADGNGGALYVEQALFTLTNSALYENEAKNGGNIALVKAVSATIDNGDISESTATENGGGIYVKNCKVEIINTRYLQDNKAKNGGAIYAEDNAVVEISGSSSSGWSYVQKNSAVNSGGGIALVNGAQAKLSGFARINDNEATNGGGVYADNASIGLDGAYAFVRNNKATNGGGMYLVNGAQGTIENNAGVGDIASGVAYPNTATNNGGGVYVTGEGSALTIVKGYIKNNKAEFDGGGVYAVDNASVIVSPTSTWAYIQDNTAVNGGGMAITDNASVSIGSTVRVRNNTAVDGGGIYVKSASISLLKGYVESNTATGCGGGIYAETLPSNDALKLDGSKITSNTGVKSGGLHIVNGDNAVAVQISNATIEKNTATGSGSAVGGYAAGGICYVGNMTAANAGLKISNTVVRENSATGSGDVAGGIAFACSESLTAPAEWNVSLTSSAIYNNTSAGSAAKDMLIAPYLQPKNLSAQEMQASGQNFSNNYWFDQKSEALESKYEQTTDWSKGFYLTTGTEVAEYKGIKYMTLAGAVKAAEEDADPVGPAVIKLTAGGNGMIVLPDDGDETIGITVPIEINLNSRWLYKYYSGYKAIFSIEKGGSLTLSGTGTITGAIAVNVPNAFTINAQLSNDPRIWLGVNSFGWDDEGTSLVPIKLGPQGSFVSNEPYGSLYVHFPAGFSFDEYKYRTTYSGADEKSSSMLIIENGSGQKEKVSNRKFEFYIGESYGYLTSTADTDQGSLWISLSPVLVDGGVFLSDYGNDLSDGLTYQTAVKTFARALEVFNSKPAGVPALTTIYIIDDPDRNGVTVSGTETWQSTTPVTVKRFVLGYKIRNFHASGEPLITVTGKLTLGSGITIDGDADTYTYADTNCASLIKVTSNGSLTLDGAKLRNNNIQWTFGQSSSVQKSYLFRSGGAVYTEGKFTMASGTIESCKALLGGGVFVADNSSARFTMTGGTIQNNNALGMETVSGGKLTGSGGGVCVYGLGAMEMTGGDIINNQAQSDGGGIALGSSVFTIPSNGSTISLKMSGGNISNNSSGSYGGGLLVQGSYRAKISGGKFTENKTGNGAFGGGAIYVNSGNPQYNLANGRLDLYMPLIRDNTTATSGGNSGGAGIAGCDTSSVIIEPNSAFIYNNTSSGRAEDILVATSNGNGSNGASYVENGPASAILELMPDGTPYHWKGTSGKEVESGILTARGYLKQLHTDATPGTTDGLYQVEITNNSAYWRGGGIGTNGDVYIHGSNTTALTVAKRVTGSQGDRSKVFHFTVTLSDESINGTYGDMEFINGKAEFTLTDGESKTATNLPYDITYEVVEAEADQDGYTTTSTEAKGELTTAKTATFINSKGAPQGDLSVRKTVTGNGATLYDTMEREYHFTITLDDANINGIYGDMEFINGVAEFTLKNGEKKTARDLPVGVRYKVEETDDYGFTTTFTGETGTITANTEAEAAFINTRNGTGRLRVRKVVLDPSGGSVDNNKEFSFRVTLDDPSITTGVGVGYGNATFNEGVAEFTLKNGQTWDAIFLPVGLKFTVEEIGGNDGYFVAVVSENENEQKGDIGTPASGKSISGRISTRSNDNNFVTFTNISAGDLKVTKTVVGHVDPDAEFTFEVTLKGEVTVWHENAQSNNTLKATDINGAYGNMTFKNGVATFTLKHGESKTATGLPAGISYTVTEASGTDYAATWTNQTGIIGKDKTVAVTCTNTRKTGDLTVEKTVTGTGGDTSKAFSFRVTLSDRSISGSFGDMTFTNGVAEFTLHHGESKTATGLPTGVTYTVEETDSDDYTVTATGQTGAITDDSQAKASFINHRDEPTPEPTSEPTPEPSPEPTPEVTSEPTPTATPTATNTPSPTPVPTETPIPEYISISGTKHWVDQDNAANIRPEAVIVRLLRNGSLVDTRRITEADGWQYTFDDLPKTDERGVDYVYEVTEQLVEGYYTMVDGYDLTNVLLPDRPENPVLPEEPGELLPPGFNVKLLTAEQLSNLLHIFDYDTPLFGILLGTGLEIPTYPFIFAGMGCLALIALLATSRKKKRNPR